MFVITAILFDLIVLGINSAVSSEASSGGNNRASDTILVIFILMTILVNTISTLGLYVGRQTRQKLLSGLVEMYTDNEVDKYYDDSLIANYGTRYLLFGAVIIILGLTAIIVPLIIRLV